MRELQDKTDDPEVNKFLLRTTSIQDMELENDDSSRATSILNEIVNMANQNIEKKEIAHHEEYKVRVHQKQHLDKDLMQYLYQQTFNQICTMMEPKRKQEVHCLSHCHLHTLTIAKFESQYLSICCKDKKPWRASRFTLPIRNW